MIASSFRASNRILPLILVAVGFVLLAILVYRSGFSQCDPQEAEATLATYPRHEPSAQSVQSAVGPRRASMARPSA